MSRYNSNYQRINIEPRHSRSLRELLADSTRPSPNEERDAYIDAVLARADGQLVPLLDATLAMASDRSLARAGRAVRERSAARARLRAALAE